MTLKGYTTSVFSASDCIKSHRIRLALAIKQIPHEIYTVDELLGVVDGPGGSQHDIETLLRHNPSGNLPTLVERDLVLHEPNVIIEYLEARHPSPPLFPSSPVDVARLRQELYQFDRIVLPAVESLSDSRKRKTKAGQAGRQALRDKLLEISPELARNPFYMKKELSVLDCALLPVLWRLKALTVDIAESEASGLFSYMGRMFETSWYDASLLHTERGIER